jgi:hypothetical protein
VTGSPTALEQAIFVHSDGAPHEYGRSEGFSRNPSWPAEAERLCVGFGTPPPGVRCPLAVFAHPFAGREVAVVQVADRPGGGLAFRLIIVPRRLYAGWIANPFLVSDRFPPDWSNSGPLPELSWPAGPPALTTLAELQQALQTGGSQTLLGGVQALVDGSRLVFQRPAPATHLLRDLWHLLPYSTRGELWPADFAFSNALGFDVLAVPSAEGLALDRYLSEEQVVDYPEGRYELALQYAVEHSDQGEIDRLLHRRSSKQTLRLALFILVGGVLAYVAFNLVARFI